MCVQIGDMNIQVLYLFQIEKSSEITLSSIHFKQTFPLPAFRVDYL